eukprot:3744677-Pyramimonas_sp.AAC.1
MFKNVPGIVQLYPGEISRVARNSPCQVFGNPPGRAVRGGGRLDGAPSSLPRSATSRGVSKCQIALYGRPLDCEWVADQRRQPE